MALSGDALIEAVAELRAQHVALDQRVGAVRGELVELRSDLESKHKENRESIHNLRNGQQTILETIRVSLEKIYDKIEARVDKVEADVVGLRMKGAKIAGIGIAISVVASAFGAIAFEIVKVVLERAK